jgi:hypothetical protein
MIGLFDCGPPPEVIEAWVKECHCCRECGVDVPCPGVCAGGLCDGACRCNDEDGYCEKEVIDDDDE